MDSPPVPSSPSNPPSPNSQRDVPLLRLDTLNASSFSSSSSPVASSNRTGGVSPLGSNRRRGTTSSSSTAPPLRASDRMAPAGGLHGPTNGGGVTPRERKQSNPLSQFRSSSSLRSTGSNGTQRAGGKGSALLGPGSSIGARKGYGNQKGKDRYSDRADDDEVDLLGGGSQPGMRGRGESDGDFDEGWTGDLPGEEEEIVGLLRGDKVSRPGNWRRRGLTSLRTIVGEGTQPQANSVCDESDVQVGQVKDGPV